MTSEAGGVPRIPLQVSRDCIIASIQVDLGQAVLRRFREDLLGLLQSSGAGGVILDLSGIAVMDHRDFEGLRSTMSMARLMGAPSVLAGLRPGVVSSLVELEVDTEDIRAAFDLDDAFRIMEQLRAGDGAEDEDERFGHAPQNQL